MSFKLSSRNVWKAKGLGQTSFYWRFRLTAFLTKLQRDTHFALAYGSKAILSIETIISSHKRNRYDPDENEEFVDMFLDLFEEMHDEATLKAAACRKKDDKTIQH